MTRTQILLPLALTACLALAGCGPTTSSAPSLSSDNRGERLQAVHQAQNKWGAHKRAKTADQEAIVGRWNHPLIGTNYLLFNADGTFKRVALLGSVEGTYRFLSDDVIEFNHQGILPRLECKYRLVGDRLEIKDGSFVTYRKATP